jgi:FkbM family methyltransferase
MRIRPLWLREKLYYRLYATRAAEAAELFEGAPVEFAPGVSMNLLPSDVGHQVIAFTGFYELEVTRRIARLARAGGLMIDVGANYGYYSCLWAATRPANRVVAFEPVAANVAAMRANLARNRLESQVQVRAMALGRQSGRLPFKTGAAGQSGWGMLAGGDRIPDCEVSVVTADEALAGAEYARIDVLKIDVEGADTWVIEGARKLLAGRRIRHVFFERNEPCMLSLGVRAGEAQRILREANFIVEHLGGDEWHAELRD